MKIGKATIPESAICTSDDETIVVRGEDLCRDLIGKLGFVDYFFLLVTGQRPNAMASQVLDATLVAIAEHGLVPSVQASR
ncbi:MAG: citryl-CoA lyase, partial [Rubrivivax sp.]